MSKFSPAVTTLPMDIFNDGKVTVLLLAAVVDYLVGDPWDWLHPVQVLGWIINQFSQVIIQYCQIKWQRRLLGVILSFGLIFGSGIFVYLIVTVARLIHPLVGILTEIVILASCLATRSLKDAAWDVLHPFNAGDFSMARQQLSKYVGRDTINLSPSEILRAILETVAENTTDGVTAPLFYAIIGSLLPLTGGAAALAFAYKAASTLDSMIGYRREPYTDIGWFSAQLEDRLTWLPCRLTVITIALISRKPRQVWHLCLRDAVKDPSPNSGWSECVYAAVLGVQLGGDNYYGGLIRKKPLLGEPQEPITSTKVEQALVLTRSCFLLWLAIAVIIISVRH